VQSVTVVFPRAATVVAAEQPMVRPATVVRVGAAESVTVMVWTWTLKLPQES